MRRVGIVAAVLFVSTVWLANYAVAHWGTPTPGGTHVISVGFGLTAPSGVLFVGLAFTLRDVVHRSLGRHVVILAILVGAALSYLIEANAQLGGPVSLATASAIAFLVSESSDLAVYEPMRKRGWLKAVVASNIVGLFADSLLFLYLAFGSLSFLWGQVVGKAWMTALAVLALWLWQSVTEREAVPA